MRVHPSGAEVDPPNSEETNIGLCTSVAVRPRLWRFDLIPDTKAEDGDPLDVLVLTDEPTVPGCAVDCRLIGVIEAEQAEKAKTKRNDRLIAVAEQSVLYQDVQKIDDLNPTVLRQIEAFFVNYQKVRDIEYTVISRNGPQRARELVVQASRKEAA